MEEALIFGVGAEEGEGSTWVGLEATTTQTTTPVASTSAVVPTTIILMDHTSKLEVELMLGSADGALEGISA